MKQTESAKIILSPKARELQTALSAVDAIDPIRQEKVARLKRKVHSRTYRIDSRRVARGIIREAMMVGRCGR